jgi:hypothetical protein
LYVAIVVHRISSLLFLFEIVDLKEQLFGWSDPISADENFEDIDENRTSQLVE